MTPDFWDVSTWVSVDSRRPVESKKFIGRSAEADAKRYAAKREEQIKTRGYTHTVTVTPGMVHKP